MLDCALEVPFNKCFSRLKSLSIGGSVLFEIQNVHNTRQLVLDFPVLLELKLRYCKWLNVESVEIRAPALIRFKANCILRNNDCTVKISGANLAEFKSSGIEIDNFVLSSEIVYYASLKHFGITEGCVLRVNNILKAMRGLKHLELANIETLVKAKPGLVLPTFDQLKHLEVIGSCEGKDVLEFLETAPCVESLTLDMGYRSKKYDYERVGYSLPCLVSHLKQVTLTDFRGDTYQVDLAKFILKNARKLEKLTIFVEDMSRKSETEIELVLLRLPKSSTYVSIVVNPRECEYQKRAPTIFM